MKLRILSTARLSFPLASALATLLAVQSASAVTYYWDSDSTTPGFGATTGTWGTNAFWTVTAAGGSPHSAVTTTLAADVVNFGTASLNYGNAVVGVDAGGVTATSIVIGAGQTTDLTVSGGTITLGGATRTIVANSSGHSITAPIALTGATVVSLAWPGGGVDSSPSFTLGAMSGTGGLTLQNTAGSNPNPATFVLSGASTYSGNTLLNSTTTNASVQLTLGVANALPATTVLTIDGGAGSGSGRTITLNMSGKDQTLAGLTSVITGTLRGNRVLNSSATLSQLTIDGSTNSTYAGQIGSGGANIRLVKSGTGTFTLSGVTALGTNTYNGGTILNQGTLTVTNDGTTTSGRLGATTGALTVNNNNTTAAGTNAVLNLATGVDTTVGTLSGTISTPLSGTNTATINTQTTRTFTVNQTAAGTYDGVIAGAGNFTLGSLSTNALTLSGLNTFTGNVTVSAGTLVANNTETASAGPLGAANSTRTITISSGATLQLAQAKALKALFNSANVPSLIINGSVNNTNLSNPGNNPLGNLTLNNGTLTASTGHPNYGGYNLNNTVTSTGTSLISSTDAVLGRMMLNSGGSFITPIDVTSGTLTISAPLAEVTVESAVSGLTKSGAGTLVLSGVNTYTGATTVSAGTLSVNGSLSSSTIALNSGTLTGSGTVNAVNVADSVSAIISNNNGSPGASLTTGAVTFSGAATVNTFSASTSAPVIAGALSTNAAGTVTINPTATSWTTGSTYELISYTGGSIGGAGFGQFVLGTVPGTSSRGTKTLADSGTAITLTLGVEDNPYWTGAANGNWNTTETNWKLITAGTDTQFIAADILLFNDLGTNTTIDINAANVAPTSITFNNTSGVPYTIGSTGGFGITSGSLTKNNTGTVTLGTNNTYTGATEITDGTLNLTGSLTGTVITVSGSGVLSESSSGVIGGAISLTHSSSGTSTLAGVNTYTGTTTLNGGILRATTNASALGAGSLTLAGGELQLADDIGLNFGRDTTVTGSAQITSDTLTAVAGVTQTLGTLSIGGQTLTIAKGSLATGITARVTFGATTLTGAPTFSIGTDSALALAAVPNAGNTITLTGAGNFSQTGTLSGVGGLDLNSGFSGTATLSGTATNYSGATTISGGKLVLASTTAFASAVAVNAGGTLQYSPTGNSNQAGVGAISLLGTLTYAPASNVYQVVGTLAGNKIVTVSGGASIINISPGGVSAASNGGLYLDGGLQGSAALTVNATTDGFGLVLRNAASTYSGTMTVNGNANTTPGLGSGLALVGATVNLQNATLTINGTLELGNADPGMGWAETGTISGATQSIDALNGTGVVVANMATAASTRTLSVGNNGGTGNFSGVIANGVNNTLGFIKAGSGTQTLSGLSGIAANNHSGATSINNGTLEFTTTSPSLTGGLTFGSAGTNTTPGILDLTTTSGTFAGALTVNTNSATPSEIKIGAAQTLTINNNVTLVNNTDGATNALTMNGGGALVVTGASFAVGNNSAGSNLSSKAILNLSALSAVTATLSGNLSVQLTGDNNGADASSLILSNTANNLTAASVGVGVSPTGSVNRMTLGAGTNVIRTNTLNLGTGSRDSGVVNFGVNVTGSVDIKDLAGTGPLVFNMGTGGATTAYGAANVFDVSGHNAILQLGAVNIGTQLSRVGSMNNVFSFDQGTLSMTSLNLSSRNTANGTTSTFNIGGGTVTSGAITMATTANALGVAVANLNITGSANVTLSGDITKGGGAGTDTANFTLNGSTAVLDMAGFNLGGAGANALDSVTLAAGELKNVASINGTGGLTKTTAGALLLSGTSSYSGNTTVSAGTLTISSAAGPANANAANDASSVTIASTGATLDLTFTGTDLVDKLFIGATQQNAGIYGHTNSGATNGGLGLGALDAYFGTGTGTLTVLSNPPAGYTSWATLNGASLNLNDDHDNDGVNNGTEYFIGGPTGNTTGFTPLPGVINTLGVLSVTWTKAANYTGTYGTDFSVETSATLTGVWATEPSPGTVTISGNDVTYTFPPGTINFARLKVTGP